MVDDQDIQKEINNLRKNLGANNYIIPHKLEKIKNLQHIYLDTLARFLTGKKDTCIAIYYHDHKENKELWIANNYHKVIYAEECLGLLQEFIKSDDKRTKKTKWEKLLWLAIEKIDEKMGFTDKETEKNWVTGLKEWNDFIKLLIKENKINYQELLTNSQQLFQAMENLNEKSKIFRYSDYLSPLYDLGLIVQEINKGNNSEIQKIIEIIQDKQRIKFISGAEKTCEHLKTCQTCLNKKKVIGCKACVKMIKKDPIFDFCRNRIAQQCICVDNSVHAEMKIINQICTISNLEKQKIYIGISKLCCAPCKKMVELFFTEEEIKETENYHVCGTHGNLYENWVGPKRISEDIKEKFLEWIKESVAIQITGNKWETTAQLPTQEIFISLLNDFLNFEQSATSKAVIETKLNIG